VPRWSPPALPSARWQFFTQSSSAFILLRHRNLGLGRGFGTIHFCLVSSLFLWCRRILLRWGLRRSLFFDLWLRCRSPCLGTSSDRAFFSSLLLSLTPRASVPEGGLRQSLRQSLRASLRLCRWLRQRHHRSGTLSFLHFSFAICFGAEGKDPAQGLGTASAAT